MIDREILSLVNSSLLSLYLKFVLYLLLNHNQFRYHYVWQSSCSSPSAYHICASSILFPSYRYPDTPIYSNNPITSPLEYINFLSSSCTTNRTVLCTCTSYHSFRHPFRQSCRTTNGFRKSIWFYNQFFYLVSVCDDVYHDTHNHQDKTCLHNTILPTDFDSGILSCTNSRDHTAKMKAVDSDTHIYHEIIYSPTYLLYVKVMKKEVVQLLYQQT